MTTNKQRAEWGRDALDFFLEDGRRPAMPSSILSKETLAEEIGALITYLYHLGTVEGLEVDLIQADALDNFQADLFEEAWLAKRRAEAGEVDEDELAAMQVDGD